MKWIWIEHDHELVHLVKIGVMDIKRGVWAGVILYVGRIFMDEPWLVFGFRDSVVDDDRS
jgi:hypothetical protein